jgi:hypothetical protein
MPIRLKAHAPQARFVPLVVTCNLVICSTSPLHEHNRCHERPSGFLTQPSLSRQIRQFEPEIGVDLFERSSAETTLTAAGMGPAPTCPGHELSEGGDACAVSDIDNVRVLAHGRNEVPVTHDCAQFSEHTRVCAEAGDADAYV